MCHSNRGAFRNQVNFLRRQFLQDGDLPFTDVLTEEIIAQALAALTGWLDRIFPPLVTLWVFLGQVLSADHSCRAAVARLIAHRRARGQRPCSAQTGAYCQARKRLPESLFADVACSVGRALDGQAQRRWLWHGRRVYLFDGTTVTMPDTPKNQAAYRQVYNQKSGLGFPIARLGALISLWCGAVVNLGFCQYAGKGQGEVSLLRRLWDVLCPGDVLLADRLTANWANMVFLRQRGVELVSRLNKAHRKADFRRGRRLGVGDHIVRWAKPTSIRSLDRQTYQALPQSVTVREVRVRVPQPGFRAKSIVVVTTLLDPRQASKEDLGPSTALAGTPRSTKRAAAQAVACTSAAPPPRIAAAALLQLAQWCQARRAAQPGGAPCPTTLCNVCPPAPGGCPTATDPDATLGAARARAAAGAVPGAQPAGGAAPPPPARKGGGA